ncbi:hypothetical protein [Aeromonas cavernicola]|uniref:Uncharacterized protein n=1 Tax=Aeromonas cavernicola TaxID=1006623 RepID=A0A2H9U865_9GAMM|nr:hypothetical protein [Aeromonas cavernicola]PJG60237.1 hypothetical protein CUC53_03045 [Aeromonas cavernicola]
MKTTYEKDLARLNKKGTDVCSICHVPFDDDDVVYTVFGYNRLGKLQVTSGYCIDKIVDVRLIGLCGEFDPDRFNAYLREHPLYESFMKKKAALM